VSEDAAPQKQSVLTASWFGRVDYRVAWRWQRDAFAARLQGSRGDRLARLEHPPTYTLGRRSRPEELIYGEAERRARGISLYEVDRGGRATFHGPGQLVGYPILALGGRYDVLNYLRGLEEALIRTTAELGIAAQRDAKHTGVWVGPNKLAAIGVKITRGITMHGFALNVTTDLSMYEGIVPCGLEDHWVTSIRLETGRSHSLAEVAARVASNLADVLDRGLEWAHERPPTTDRFEPGRTYAEAIR
jgi:lipoyl(octanoyl) transferase